MLMEVKRNLNYIKKAIIYNLKSALEYKTSFLTQAVFMFINNSFFLVFWKIVFNISSNQTNGLQMKNILYLWAIPTIGFGLSHLLFGGVENISKNLIDGGMDSYLTQPKNAFINIATSKCDFVAFGDLTYGLFVGIFAANNIQEYLLIVFYGILACIIMTATMTIIRSLAGFVGEIEELAERYEHVLLINFSVYPEEIFGKIVKLVLYTIVPAGYIVHLPIQIIHKFNIIQFSILIIATIIYIIIARVIFKEALNRYESGNAMILKG